MARLSRKLSKRRRESGYDSGFFSEGALLAVLIPSLVDSVGRKQPLGEKMGPFSIF